LLGLDPVVALRIIEMRAKSRHFKRVEVLLAIHGISQKKLDAVRPYITISTAPPSATTPQKNTVPLRKAGMK
jgi:helix-hairpin-helix protein